VSLKVFRTLVLLIVGAVLAFVLPLRDADWIGTQIVLRAAFWGSVLFVILYTCLTPWWHNVAGRMYVSLDLGVALALLGPILKLDFGVTLPEWLLIRFTVVALGVVAGTVLSRTVLLGHLHEWKVRLPWKHYR